MKRLIYYLSFFILSYFVFNYDLVNSNDDIALTYSKENIYAENIYNVSFYDLNILDIDKVFKGLNIKIMSVILEDNKFNDKSLYYTNSEKLIEYCINYLKERGYEEESIYISTHGLKIKSIRLKSNVNEIIKLEKRTNVI